MRKGRRIVVAALVLVVARAPSANAVDAAPCRPPRCLDVAVPLPDGIKVPDNHVRILLPKDYEDRCARYPVLYLLHGVGDTFKSWSEQTDVIAFSEKYPVVVVMPDGGHGPQAGWGSDWVGGPHPQWETFHTEILPGFVDRTFRTRGAGHRAAAGQSMGGFAAMSYAARRAGLFQAAASFSGFVDTLYGFPASGPLMDMAGKGVGGQSLGTPREEVWGSQLTAEQTWREHNPTDLAKKLGGVSLFVTSGSGTPLGPAGDDPSLPHAYAIENYVLQVNLSFTRALDSARVSYAKDLYAGGYHGWPYFQWALHAWLDSPAMVTAIGRADPC